MPPKRHIDQSAGGEDLTGREKKKQKITAARTIAVQRNPSSAGNASAGSSKVVRLDSECTGMPWSYGY